MRGEDGEDGQVLLGRKGLTGRPGEQGLVGPRGLPGQKVTFYLKYFMVLLSCFLFISNFIDFYVFNRP